MPFRKERKRERLPSEAATSMRALSSAYAPLPLSSRKQVSGTAATKPVAVEAQHPAPGLYARDAWQAFEDSSDEHSALAQAGSFAAPQAPIAARSYLQGLQQGLRGATLENQQWAALAQVRAAKVAFDPSTHPQAKSNPFWEHDEAAERFAHVKYLFVGQEIFRRGPLVARGSYSKIYNVVDAQGNSQVARLLHRSQPRSAGKGKHTVHASALQDIALEYRAMEAINSPLLPTRIFYLRSSKNGVVADKLYWLQRSYETDLQLFGTPDGAAAPLGALRHLARTLVNQLANLHAQNLVHRDVKACNVLYNRGGDIVLADFGLVGEMPISLRQRATGTLGYMAPEAYGLGGDHVILDGKLDIFSLGMLLSHVAFPRLTYDLPMALSPVSKLVQDKHGQDCWRVIPKNYDDALGAAEVTALYDRRQAGKLSEEEQAFYSHAHSHAFYAIERLKRAWYQLDPMLGTLVADKMLATYPQNRYSAAMSADMLNDWPNALEQDHAEAARYFDWVFAKTRSTQTQAAVSLEALKEVPPAPPRA